ncbi:RagB/SusD family nutrient uptake outer membrane protein [Pedobacter helvus]|uniref:RagB/SusD family nutrient uptake outer membrane protein n=1 Tax=Pedobacter helvus TaxID=2563444 RepID=A0ABW9JK71_9SPHI|nr:RagB/SusD family nutrient uptake outer membrane protein [Pedobacter ureilyticus]
MKIKSIKTAFLVLAMGAISLPSCKKVLDYDSESNSSTTVVFGSLNSTNTALIAVYNRLIGDNGYGSRISTLFGVSADDFRTSGSYGADDRRGLSMYGASPNNTDLINPFAQLYSGVERANLCIKFIPESQLYANGSATEQATMRRYLGEALALRAQFYYELIRNWGDVPQRFKSAAYEDNLFPPNANRDETYDVIIEDLKTAAELVPWRSDIQEYGSFRYTKGAIKALRARIALARGGYSLRTETKMMERRADYLKYYQIAFEECQEIIANPAQHDLNPVFENVFKTLHGTRMDSAHELMFEVAAFGGNSNTDSKLGYYNGLRFNSASEYGQGGGGMVAIPTYFYEFDKRDLRRDVTLGVFEINANSKKIINTLNNMSDAKFRKSWTAFNKNSTSQTFAVNWPMIRFSDVLLMFAEADNEINPQPSAAAIAALKKVQDRAYGGATPADLPAIPTNKADFFNAIVKERLLEFGGEGMRKYDLIRWNLINSKFQETRTKLADLIAGTGAYTNVPEIVYTKESNYNLSPSSDEVASMDLFGGTANVVLYQLGQATTPTGYTARNWRKSLTTENQLTSTSTGFAFYFEPNKKELFPYPNTALNQNTNMKQNFGYVGL